MWKNCIPKHGTAEAVVLLLKIIVQIESMKMKEKLQQRLVLFTRVAVFLFLSMNKKKIPKKTLTTTTLRWLRIYDTLTQSLPLTLTYSLTLQRVVFEAMSQ